jgi:hypothetical protein
VLAILVGGAFAVLVAAIGEQRRSAHRATRSQEELVVAATWSGSSSTSRPASAAS